MADGTSVALEELLRKAQMSDGVDIRREGFWVLAQALMEAEVAQHVGAGRHERSAERTGKRNGHRERHRDTRVGSIQLRVPRVRDGSYFPTLLEPHRRAERPFVAVVQEAYVQGVSTRQVDELVQRAAGTRRAGDQQESGVAGLPGTRYRGRALPQSPVR